MDPVSRSRLIGTSEAEECLRRAYRSVGFEHPALASRVLPCREIEDSGPREPESGSRTNYLGSVNAILPLREDHLDARVPVGVARLQAGPHRAQVVLPAGQLHRVQRRGNQVLIPHTLFPISQQILVALKVELRDAQEA